MPKPPLTPGEVALADQLLTATSKHLAELARAVRTRDAEIGEAQSTADFIAYLRAEHNASYLAALVVTAIRQNRTG